MSILNNKSYAQSLTDPIKKELSQDLTSTNTAKPRFKIQNSSCTPHILEQLIRLDKTGAD
jgi:hypothetical protein